MEKQKKEEPQVVEKKVNEVPEEVLRKVLEGDE